ncbi:MAG: hypothetical protein DRO01_05765 [Thermoproteota archaeon]|nr:MAG: hypothetical protein DRO01_05765 [Candidatus Korarchaeota archaeon]
MAVTFPPGDGFTGNEVHEAVGRITTELAESGEPRARLFYAINRDPALAELPGEFDEDESTHFLDLTIEVGGDAVRGEASGHMPVPEPGQARGLALSERGRAVGEDAEGVEFYEEYSPLADP